MNIDMDDWGPATTLVVAAALIIVIVGGIVCIFDDSFSFQNYTTSIIGAAVSLGLLSVGRGVRMQHQPVMPPKRKRKSNPASTPREQKVRGKG